MERLKTAAGVAREVSRKREKLTFVYELGGVAHDIT